MKLKFFTPDNLPVSTKGKPAIYINAKVGMLHISSIAADKIGLKEGDFIELSQDEESLSDWYLSKSKSGFALRNKKKGSSEQGLIFNNVALAKMIFESVEYNSNSGRCLFGAEPVKVKSVEFWPIITASLLTEKK